ncbi:MAG TPA: endonuclease/exonuclease/phosphatase family protein [Chthoniobacteraceae bacterium]|jgi:endonuclease/exonuclease/phosphatase family metal-dependent hydrolase|nr:endonuclease/exonuclease/phosphatase family protein [Chthoniobacteraceae bacterium]
MTLFRNLLLAAVWAVFDTSFLSAADPDSASDIKVMSYNIRYGTAKDGENHWDKRKDFLAETIKAANPDLLGTQETLGFQRDFLAETLPTHEVLAAGREDGKEKGETTAIYWRKDRFEKLDGGHFWLSETPAEAGSMGWDTSLPRMATWVRLKDKAKEGKPVLWINTHFDHKGPVARLESAKLIRNRLPELGKDCSLIVTGDFNAGEGSEPYKAMFGLRGNEESPVVDSLRVAHPTRGVNEGTTTPFLAVPGNGARIDWIALSRDWKVIAATIEHPNREGRTASDHFPVTATLRR